MGSIAALRVKRDVKEVKKAQVILLQLGHSNNDIELVDEKFDHLKGKILGPPDTPYEGGVFEVDIKIPYKYPFDPPKVCFITKIWHPNISSITGSICLNILKDKWVPVINLGSLLISLQILLSKPESDDPLNAVVAEQMTETPDIFLKTAKHWTRVYAGGPCETPDLDEKIKNLMDMGVEEDRGREALSNFFWDEQSAVGLMFN